MLRLIILTLTLILILALVLIFLILLLFPPLLDFLWWPSLSELLELELA